MVPSAICEVDESVIIIHLVTNAAARQQAARRGAGGAIGGSRIGGAD
jgi:hypothetical protein